MGYKRFIGRVAIRNLILVTLAISGFGGLAFADELIEVTASVNRQTAFVGDLIDYSITITYDSTVELTPPAVGANLGGFTVKDYNVGNEKVLDGGRRRQRLDFRIRTFTTGDYVIPPLAVEYRTADSTLKTIAADPIRIVIKSVLGDVDSNAVDTLQPRPLKDQISLSSGLSLIYILLIGAALLAAGAYIYMKKRRRKAEPEEAYVDPRSAWEIAFTDLALLKDRHPSGAGEFKLFYIEISEIIRDFMGRQFGFDAIDMTTEEIGDTLRVLEIDDELGSDYIQFLYHADLVKFAKYVPSADKPREDWDIAYNLVDRGRTVFPGLVGSSEPAAQTRVLTTTDSERREYSDLDYAPPELRDHPPVTDEEDSR